MFGIFDNLSDRNDVYKVETVKDSFVGVSGAPEKVSALNPRKNDAIILSSNEILQLYIQAICIVMLNVNILTNSTCKCLIAEQKSCWKNHGHGLRHEGLCIFCQRSKTWI